ncbi:MAG TPA: hypothetical protein VG815_21145 [Chloroflexota bacterium]|jgi:hypothetical protein|nr:hypothetical protein [Chloroflexota bacterium]
MLPLAHTDTPVILIAGYKVVEETNLQESVRGHDRTRDSRIVLWARVIAADDNRGRVARVASAASYQLSAIASHAVMLP